METIAVKLNGQLKSSTKYATMSVSEEKAYFSHAVMLAFIEELGCYMAKTSKHQEQEIGGFDETFMDNLNPEDSDFVEKFIEAVKRPIEIVKDEK